MPRIARIVAAGLPHHVTQRGNRRETVFFGDEDYRAYLVLLDKYAARHGVEVIAYCLMPNHVHLVVVPSDEHALHRTFKPLHMLYAQRINRRRDWCGHLWQDRYFSSTLDERYFWAAVRYVERNPVRAGLVVRAEAYPWSSARAHCEGLFDPTLAAGKSFRSLIETMQDWSAWLSADDDPVQLDQLRRCSRKGVPCAEEKGDASLGEGSVPLVRFSTPRE